MKTFISTLAGLACTAAFTSVALADAPGTDVRVKFDEAKMTVAEIQPPLFSGAKGMAKVPTRYYIDVPMNVQALSKSGEKPRSGTLDNLTVTFYLLVKNPNPGAGKNSYLKITKPIHYVNVPVPGAEGSSSVTTHAACFLPPSTVRKLTGRENTRAGDLSAYLTLISVDASYNDKPCKETKDKFAYATKMFGNDNDLRKGLKDLPRWWTIDAKRFPETTDYPVRTIAETPFAAQASGYFPETNPMYGAAPAEPATDPAATDTEN